MTKRSPKEGKSLHHIGCLGSSRISRLLEWLCLLLLINHNSYALEAPNRSLARNTSTSQENKANSFQGELCCPEDKYFDTASCVSFNDSTRFRNPSLNHNVSWTYQEFKCTFGYEPMPIEVGNSSLVLDRNSVFLKWTELLQKTTTKFCLSLLPADTYIGVICRPNIEKLCTDATCVQKCCDRGEVASLDGKCVSNPDRNFSLTFQSVSGLEVRTPANLRVIHQIPNCNQIVLLNPEINAHEHFFLTEDGYLYQPAKENTYHENRFCLDYFQIAGATGKQLGAFICSEPGLPIGLSLKDHFYSAGLIISAISLSVTILCNNLISKLRELQDINQLCHMISLLVGEISLFTGYLFTNHIHSEHCVINAIITQFALLSAFFWLNVMCFDIHQYVRATMKLIPRSAMQGRRGLRFKCYSAYAWGTPFIITLATTVLHYFPDIPGQIILRPGFGVKNCWFYGDIERLTFFYVWIGVLFVGNIFLLTHTAYMMHRTGIVLRCCRKKPVFEEGGNHVSSRKNVEKFWQSFSLFALMALCWVTEILSWKIPPESLWILTDMINTLQGFFIFLFFLRIKTKREILKEAILNISEKARKISLSEGSSGSIWHCSRATSGFTEFDRQQSEMEREPHEIQLQSNVSHS